MKIGIIGAGFIGRAVAAVAMKAGHDVMISNSRGPETLFSLVGSTGCKAGTTAEAAAFGDFVVIAIPLKAYQTIPIAELKGKIVVDANNYYAARDGQLEDLDRGELTSSELIARHLPESQIVKAFNAIAAADIEKDGRPAGAAKRRALPIAGENAAAKEIVTELFDQFGFDVVDAGPLAEGRRFQPDTPGYCIPLDRAGMQAALAAA
ncbi:NADPH-dependent F420 reductase [Pseudooceanicola spongiae]|uniref:NADP oxidoreductase n=1 Tax=Pseudooceanicola spongiae TaxID=2613965 RepID=A0A7L9WJZ1_9RHOB|nr:NAD(P)-binding domain-containing protein [Pseudooceanicola spongiae]QOL79686.1 NADP oxidoreductase [Pseudooceanicola spongiae]